MTAEHPDADIVTGGHRAAQQMIFTVTQLVENVARMRQAAETRRADAARAAASRQRDVQRVEEARQRATVTADRAAQGAARDAQRISESQRRAAIRAAEAQARAADRAAATQQREAAAAAAARQRTDRAAYTAAAAPKWARAAVPVDLLTAWAAATTWAAHDPKAADVMVRTEEEMRTRWPQVIDRYDRLRVAEGLHPAAAMKITLLDAVNAGWDPTTNPAARPRAGRDHLVALTATAEQATPEDAAEPEAGQVATELATEQKVATGQRIATGRVATWQVAPAAAAAAANPAEQALRWIPTATAALAYTHAPRHRAGDDRATPTPAPAPTRHR